VEGILPLIERWGREDSGKYYDRFGVGIAWWDERALGGELTVEVEWKSLWCVFVCII
jgi:hypothetical protein